MKTIFLKPGCKVICNGCRGSVIRHYYGNMYEVRVPGGLVCVDANELELI